MNPQDLGGLFESFRCTAFRLEARDVYAVDDEAERLEAFLAGRPLPARTPANNDWLALVSRVTSGGRTVERVRLFSRPLTDYTRFEFAVYPENVAAGERIRLLDRSRLSGPAQLRMRQDFWLFDDQVAAMLTYDDAGRFVGVEEVVDVESLAADARDARQRSVEFPSLTVRVSTLGH